MRIATATMYQLATQALLSQQAALAKSQNQIATGKRVQTPSDDPVAAVQLHELARAQSQYEQYDKNSTAVTGRLQLEEQALADAGTVLQRARELVVQANTATLAVFTFTRPSIIGPLAVVISVSICANSSAVRPLRK